MELNRACLAAHILDRLSSERSALTEQWRASLTIPYFVLDDVLPYQWTQEICDAFPKTDEMTLKRSLRELKYVAAQMDKYNPLLEEAVYAFQSPEIVRLLEEITGLPELEPDSLLYAGGLSMMGHGHFLNPHIDNSHDKYRERYRVLNLLFYVSPAWTLENGCNLELWPEGPRRRPVTIVSHFNRMVLMATHRRSWHSVSRNRSVQYRCCVSNYYFSKHPIGSENYFHVTSFRGRPEQKIRDAVLRADILLRSAIRRLRPLGVRENPHFYRKKVD